MKIKKFKLLMLASVVLGLGLVSAGEASAQSDGSCSSVCLGSSDTNSLTNTAQPDFDTSLDNPSPSPNSAANSATRLEQSTDVAKGAAESQYGCSCTDQFSS